MTVQRKQRGQPEHEHLGLLANGSSGDWEVAVDETTKGPDRWFIQFEGPSAYFSFEIPSPAVISQILNFLGESSPSDGAHTASLAANSSLVLGKHQQTPVMLVRDDEYKDRIFVVIGQEADVIARFTIAGQDLKDIQESLRQAAEDLEDEG